MTRAQRKAKIQHLENKCETLQKQNEKKLQEQQEAFREREDEYIEHINSENHKNNLLKNIEEFKLMNNTFQRINNFWKEKKEGEEGEGDCLRTFPECTHRYGTQA